MRWPFIFSRLPSCERPRLSTHRCWHPSIRSLPSGVWKTRADLTSCGRTHTLPLNQSGKTYEEQYGILFPADCNDSHNLPLVHHCCFIFSQRVIWFLDAPLYRYNTWMWHFSTEASQCLVSCSQVRYIAEIQPEPNLCCALSHLISRASFCCTDIHPLLQLNLRLTTALWHGIV